MTKSEQKKYVSKFYHSVNGFKRDLIKNIKNLTDYVSIGGILYTMESYDVDGREVIYTNKKLLKSIYCNCENRYHSTSDMQVEQINNIVSYRTDIYYAE